MKKAIEELVSYGDIYVKTFSGNVNQSKLVF
jgi:hypothetical protein